MTSMILQALQRTLSVGVLALWIATCVTNVGEATPDELGGPEKANVLAGERELWYGSEAGASWQRKPAPGEGRIEGLATDPHGQGRVLLSRGGVVWMSKDGGQSWGSPIFGPVPEQGVAIAFHPKVPDTLFLATSRRLWISTNAGENWAPATPGVEFKWRPKAILVVNQEPDRMYITTRGEGVYRSDDGGHTWKAINAGLPEAIGAAPVAPIDSAVLDPTDSDVVYVAAQAEGIYKTTDGGETWIRVSKGLPETITRRTHPWVLAIDPSDPTRLLVWANWPVHSERVDSAFFLSEDGAASWRKIASGPDHGKVFAIQFVEAEAGLVAAVTEDGVVILPRLSSPPPGLNPTEKESSDMLSGDRDAGNRTSQQQITRDVGEIAVIEGDSNIIFTPKDSTGTDCPLDSVKMKELAKKFYQTHANEFQFLIAFTNFDHLLSPDENCDEQANAFYQPVSNSIQGIGRGDFDNSANYGSSSGVLAGVINMGNLADRPADPADRLPNNNDSMLSLFGQEVGHSWGAFVQFDADPGPGVSPSSDLLGRDDSHWSFFFHTASATSSGPNPEASSLEGNYWEIDQPVPGQFQTTTITDGFSPLDLYLMGLFSANQVEQFWYISNPTNVSPSDIDGSSGPQGGVQADGDQTFVTVNDIIEVEGARVPDFASSPKKFRQAFILLTRQGVDVTQDELDQIETYRDAWESYFAVKTQNRGWVYARLNDFVYVDRANAGPEDGTANNPYNTVTEGLDNSVPHGTLFITAGNYAESNLTFTEFNVPLTVRALGGTVTIGE